MDRAVEKKERQLRDAEARLAGYEWQQRYTAATAMIASQKEQLDGTKRAIVEISNLTKEIQSYSEALDEYEGEVADLSQWKGEFQKNEDRLEVAQRSYDETQTKVAASLARSSAVCQALSRPKEQLSAVKRQHLTRFTMLLTVAILLFVGGVLVPVLALLALPVLAAAAYTFYKYQQADKAFSAASVAEVDAAASSKQLDDQRAKFSKATEEMENLRAEAPYGSAEAIADRLAAISKAIKRDTDADSIEAIKALLESKTKRLNKLTDERPEAKKQALAQQIQKKAEEIDALEKQSHDLVRRGPYNELEHNEVRERVQRIRNEHSEMVKERGELEGKKGQIGRELTRLKEAYSMFPKLAEEVAKKEEDSEILQRVQKELAETSKSLRSQVIPYAGLVINQILPSLTGDRYSDFEITEDLAFKVHSCEAGGYRDREIFSGGTQDQFLIALRLAFTESILNSRITDDRYALLMDECISSSDDVRKKGIFDVLDAKKDVFSQIFLIAHEDISRYVDYHVVLGRNERDYTQIESKSW